MDDVFRRVTWFIFFLILIAYGIYTMAGNTINAQDVVSAPVVVRDQLRRGEHSLSGIVTVSLTC